MVRARAGEMRLATRAFFLLPVAAWTAPALAQQALPRIEPTRPQVEISPLPAETTVRKSTAEVDASRASGTEAPCSLADSPVKVTLSAVRFESPDHGPVAPEIAALLAGIHVSGTANEPIAAVCAIRDRATSALRGAGYIASVQIPPQELPEGVLRLTVVTARLTEVRIHGELGRMRAAIEARVAAIKALDPLNSREAERILLLTNDLPGVRVRLTLQPAGKPGEVIGDLNVEAESVLVLANVQNTGSRQLGPTILSARAELYGLTGLADRTYLGYSNSTQFREVHVVQAGHELGIGSGGIRAGVRGSFAISNPDIPNLDLRSQSTIAGFDLSAPLYRGLRHGAGRSTDANLFVGTGFELLNQRTVIRDAAASQPFTRDRLRVFYARLGGSARMLDQSGSEFWRTDGLIELRKGVGLLDATRRGESVSGYQPSRFDGDPKAFEVRGTLSQTLRPFRHFAIDTSVFGQWSNHALLNLEEFTLGNLTYGRGYDPGANGGDRAIAAHVEPRIQLPYKKFLFELTGFYDRVKIWNLDPGTLETKRNFTSVGGGVRVSLPRSFVLDVTYAKPLDRVLATDMQRPRSRLLVTLTTQLFPWRAGR